MAALGNKGTGASAEAGYSGWSSRPCGWWRGTWTLVSSPGPGASCSAGLSRVAGCSMEPRCWGYFFHWIFSLLRSSSCPRDHPPSTWVLRWFAGMTHVGLHDRESHGLWFGLFCQAKRERMRNRKKFSPVSPKNQGRPLSPTLKWRRGGTTSHRFSGATWLSPGRGMGSGGC